MTEQKKTSVQEPLQDTKFLFAQILLKTTALSFLFVLLFLFLTVLGIGAVIGSKVLQFEELTQTPKEEVWAEVKKGYQNEPKQTNQHSNFLILGTDGVNNRGSSQVLTDTMILASLDLKSGGINLLSIPRDLWSEEYKTKINALYAYGAERNPDKPQEFTAEVVGQLTDLDIHHTLVISLESLAEMIDVLGGIEVEVPVAFTDNQFPRGDVALDPDTPDSELYRSVRFEEGKQLMSGDRALEYIRSRHSQDDQGSDVARSYRQQLVIEALISKLASKNTIFDVDKLADLFKLYKNQFSNQISLTELVSISKAIFPYRSDFKIENRSLSIYPDNPQGVIEHPTGNFYQNQWVYEIRNLDQFRAEIKTKLLQN